jgi:hypothetical protein
MFPLTLDAQNHGLRGTGEGEERDCRSGLNEHILKKS